MTKSTNQQKATVAKDILWDERQFHSGIEDRLCQDQFVQEQVIKNLSRLNICQGKDPTLK